MSNARTLLTEARAALLDEGRDLKLEELAALSALPDSTIPQLAALAHEVRLARCGPEVEV
nr:biotin synthase BioB [Actinomycetota bacterium]